MIDRAEQRALKVEQKNLVYDAPIEQRQFDMRAETIDLPARM